MSDNPYGWMIPKKARRKRGGDDDGRPSFNPGGTDKDKDRKPPKPIGVPEGYTTPTIRDMTGMSARAAEGWAATGRGHGAIVEQGPRYHAGDEYRPASLDPASIGRLQATMAAAGLLTDFRYGVWDSASRKAYKELLTEANASGLTAEAALNSRAQGISFDGGGGGGRGGGGGGGRGGSWQFDENGDPMFVEEQYVPPPLELKTTNKEDLSRALRTGIIEKMGVGWNQQQVNELADMYVQMETKAQTDAYNARIGVERAEFMGERGAGGEVISEVSVPSPETFMESELQRRDPSGYATGQIVNEWIPQFMSMLGGWT